MIRFLLGMAAGAALVLWLRRPPTYRQMQVTYPVSGDWPDEDPYLRDLAAILERERW